MTSPRRHSAQLPLPPTLRAPAPPASPTTASALPAPTSPALPAPTSPTRSSFARADSPLSAHIPFHPPPAPLPSSTHAGGIQPSASFFRPARPDQQYIPAFAPSAADIFPLAKLSTRSSDGADDHTAPRVKQSSEQLLPIGTRPAPRRVRGSLERVLGITRGLSFDRSARKTIDEESGPYPPSPVSRYAESRPAPGAALDKEAAPPPAFVPTPAEPPLVAVPLTEVDGRPLRRYQRHPARNRFFLGGHLLTGGDSPWAFIGTLALLFVVAGVWFGTTCVWWWQHESPAVAAVGAYMCLIVISTMFATAFSDPGILPRELDPDPPYPSAASDNGVRAPMPRDLKVRTDVVRVKYCPTCRTYRPPRSSHCKMCDNCVDGCDHHCQWVNNCVGRRNYTTFFALLLSATLTLVLVIVTAALQLYFVAHREDGGFGHALRSHNGWGSALVFLLSLAAIWPVGALLVYHVRLLLLNVTTIEQIRNQAHKALVPGPPPPNPFSHGTWRRNAVAVLCRPPGESWLNGAAQATEDRRRVNPGLREGKEDEE